MDASASASASAGRGEEDLELEGEDDDAGRYTDREGFQRGPEPWMPWRGAASTVHYAPCLRDKVWWSFGWT